MLSLLKSLMGGGAGKPINPADYKAEFADAKKPHLLLDVRTAGEFKTGHIPGAVNIDVQSIGRRLKEIPTDRPVVVYCLSGSRSGQAASVLQSAGYTEIYDMGSIGRWRAAGYPLK